ncbi:MAG: hypothetical protein KKA55_11135 [Proteobacteria bacterium]|nr:hypothetical protein [Pseudomonadota bacterium]MBU1596073.1 hypothetical protein [Pseudomonadota bacterium]
MSTLRDTIETTFVAAAFAESNLKQEALSIQGRTAKDQPKAEAARPDAKARRQRPSLKA